MCYHSCHLRLVDWDCLGGKPPKTVARCYAGMCQETLQRVKGQQLHGKISDVCMSSQTLNIQMDVHLLASVGKPQDPTQR